MVFHRSSGIAACLVWLALPTHFLAPSHGPRHHAQPPDHPVSRRVAAETKALGGGGIYLVVLLLLRGF